MKRAFLSDNCAGAHPAILAALEASNPDHQLSYGDDESCQKASALFEQLLGRPVGVCFCFNGTGSNIVGLSMLLQHPYDCVLCADCAHIACDETGAPERQLSCKLVTIPTPDGKLNPAMVAPFLSPRGNPHHAQPTVLSLTNITEWGAVYTPVELKTLCDWAHENGLKVHLDGARIANAAAACGATLAEMTQGLDILTFGGVKNGCIFGEAVLYFDESLQKVAPFYRKNAGQLQSKLRFVGAQYEALLADDLWLKNATHANAMTKKVEALIQTIPGATIVHPAYANVLFVRLPSGWGAELERAHIAYTMGDLSRFVGSWDTEDQDVDRLEQAFQALSRGEKLC